MLHMAKGARTDPPSSPIGSPRLRRQHSLASRCCDTLRSYHRHYYFTRLPSSPPSQDLTRSLSLRHRQEQRHQKQIPAGHEVWKFPGIRSSRKSMPAQDVVEGVVSENTICSKPGRWRHFLRKLKEETKRMNCSKPSPAGLRYDALSYAMNFDDGTYQEQEH
ncbi:hypothetical protein KP509_37G044000 [Ceratopteris richardii]|uniref:Uncharacterized protein n=1 Tax=Ceratopteris richardii TaxID=49495 RepID=A0A8T2Q8D1_CERRI|nr:hypothetical protein KP509_37G044000 [Ceratopteris richardii]